MRLFVVVAVLMLTGGVYLAVDGGLRLDGLISAGLASFAPWTSDFWLARGRDASLGLSPNAQWFLRLCGALLLMLIGWIVLRVARR